MTREQIAIKNAKSRDRRSRQLVVSAVTGLYQDEYKKLNGEWNMNKIAKATGLSRQTVAKHLKIWEANIGGLFEDELC